MGVIVTSCAYCGTDIIFGGVRDGNLRYCRSDCHQKAQEAERQIAQAKQVYSQYLAEIRQDPTDPNLRQRALHAGRRYASRRRYREGGRVTLYDETAIANEINAASAAGVSTATRSGQVGEAAASVEQRLERLIILKEKGLITEEEYTQRREKILNEL